MSDTVEVKTTMSWKAWSIPTCAYLDDNGELGQVYEIEQLAPAVIDALAQTWINHLYAGLNREPPVLFPPVPRTEPKP